MKSYRLASLIGTITFAIVGLVFLFIPGQVLIFFNNISNYLAMQPSPVQEANFYLILAVAYMYMVTLLAFLMYRYPRTSSYPFLLAHAKLASCAISLYLFLIYQPYLIFIVNSVVDGCIGLMVVYFLHHRFEWEG